MQHNHREICLAYRHAVVFDGKKDQEHQRRDSNCLVRSSDNTIDCSWRSPERGVIHVVVVPVSFQ